MKQWRTESTEKNKKYIDLHIHSCFSDGSWTPDEIIKRAKNYSISAISICDHDTVAGINSALISAARNGIEFIPAFEISTSWLHGRLHIIGYYIDHNNLDLTNLLEKLVISRKERIYRMCQRLAELGMPVSPDDVFRFANKADAVGRPHVALAMKEKGYVTSVQEAFDKYICCGLPAYAPRWAPEPEEAIKAIHDAGGVAVLGHCAVTEGCMDKLHDILNFEFDGIEVYYPGHSQNAISLLTKIAQERDLAITGGSDCHGTNRGEPLLGIFKVRYECLESIKLKMAKIHSSV